MKRMKGIIRGVLLAACCVSLGACATTPKSRTEVEASRAEIREMAGKALERTYTNYPEARQEVEKAAGYGVFSNFGFKLFVMGSSRGAGMVVDAATKRETFMKMFELTPGLGLGAQKFACIFLFDTPEALNSFVNSGWEFGGATTAALQTSTQGGGKRLGAVVAPGVRMYQLSEQGAIVGISLTGARYYKDDQLN